MSSIANRHPWPPPPARVRAQDNGAQQRSRMGSNGVAARSGTPSMARERETPAVGSGVAGDGSDDAKLTLFRQLYTQSEARIAALFAPDGSGKRGGVITVEDGGPTTEKDDGVNIIKQGSSDGPSKKSARKIDEDDYDDYDMDEDDDESVGRDSVPKSGGTVLAAASRQSSSSSVKAAAPGDTLNSSLSKISSAQHEAKSSEEVREKLQEDRKAAEETVKRTFQTLFYTLENDRDAMLEQQRLEEVDRQLDAEMSGHGTHGQNVNHAAGAAGQHGKLSNANLGASSLTLKHLIARIDAKRDQVRASDAELRSLMSEVRKNRSKWANEDRVGQEELYEAAEKVLCELKAMTEHSTAFLTRVNKRDAPDYHTSAYAQESGDLVMG